MATLNYIFGLIFASEYLKVIKYALNRLHIIIFYYICLKFQERHNMNFNFNRINTKRIISFLKPTALILIGMLLGAGVIILWWCFSGTTFKKEATYDPWIISNYVFQIIGAIGTVLAVIVALAKEAIMKWLYSPSLRIELVDNGISEILPNDNQRVPEASAFECYINIENIGSIAAFGCKVHISDVKHGKSKQNVKSIKAPYKQLFWTSQNVDIPIGIPTKIRLFELANPNSIGTPSSEQSIKKPSINFNGCDFKKHQTEKGVWIFDYYITCKNGEAKRFKATIEWNGEFKSRAADMTDVLTITIE